VVIRDQPIREGLSSSVMIAHS